MATVTAVWAVYMLVGVGKYLFNDVPMPDPAIWGIPGMIWLALNPPLPAKFSQGDRTTTEVPENK